MTISNANNNLQKKLKKIADNTLDKASVDLTNYYNNLNDKDKKIDNQENKILQKRNNINIVTPSKLDKQVLNQYLSLEKKIMKLLDTMMENVYKEVSKNLRKMYGDLHYPISKIKYFDKDGLNIKDRLQKWFCPYKLNSNPSGPEAEPYIDSYNENFVINSLTAINKISIIISTECSFESETIKKDKLSGFCEWVEVCFGGGECKSDCQSFCGEYPVNEYPEPPFHSNCGCYTLWQISDDIEDVEDLDLEDDLDEDYYDDIDEEIEELENNQGE